MRFVEPRTDDQLARAVLFQGREGLVHQRPEPVNALKAMFCEFGHCIAKGIGQLKYVAVFPEDEGYNLPALVREECRVLVR